VRACLSLTERQSHFASVRNRDGPLGFLNVAKLEQPLFVVFWHAFTVIPDDLKGTEFRTIQVFVQFHHRASMRPKIVEFQRSGPATIKLTHYPSAAGGSV
jgi:hypothetical protein